MGYSFSAQTISSPEIAMYLKKHGRDRFDTIKMDIEGAEVEALTALRGLVGKTKRILIEIHGTKNEVDDILEPLRFTFRRLKRSNYIGAALLYSFKHPIASVRQWKAFRSTGENPGVGKILQGIEITRSDELMVGVYVR